MSGNSLDKNTLAKMKELTNNKARLAIELIKYDPEYEKVMQFIFGFTFIADDKETAKKVAYNDFKQFKCVTLQGDFYDP